jgi:hypothetical protein
LQMRPFLSVMHAKAHSTKCEVLLSWYWNCNYQEL